MLLRRSSGVKPFSMGNIYKYYIAYSMATEQVADRSGARKALAPVK